MTASKKTTAAEKTISELLARLAKARTALDDAFERDEDGERIPTLAATVSVIERRLVAAEKARHDCQVADAVAEIERLTTEHATVLKTYHDKKAKYEADTIAMYEKESIGRKIAKDRKYAPAWLTKLRRERHDAFARLMEAFNALHQIEPGEAKRRGFQRIDDCPLPTAPARVIEY